MSLKTFIEAGFTRVGTEFKAIRTLIGGSGTANISALTTTDKSSIVAAVNEVKAVADAAAPTDTDSVAEGATNLYYTDARADARAAAAVAPVNAAIALKANSTDVKTVTELGADVDTTDYEAVFVAALA